MNKEYYTYKDEQELSGLSFQDYIDFKEGRLKREEDILPEHLLPPEETN